jgi:(p)ppGpp synthase/HD superfamily hydrolase
VVDNNSETTNSKDFCELARQSFKDIDATLVLQAYERVAERFGTGLAVAIRAADILLRQQADPIVVTAALLVPLRRDGATGPVEVRSLFGDAIADLVEKVVPPKSLCVDAYVPPEEGLRLFLESISQDIRAVVLHLGLRLADLETLAAEEDGKNRAIAQETLNLHVPLADRMGLGVLRVLLEDVCFRILEPAIYEELARKLEPLQAEDAVCLGVLKEGIQHLLARNGLHGAVYGRTKGLYSLYCKMRRQERPLHEIMDKIGLRIIVSSVEECYAVLGLLHTHFRPIPGTFDDYIGLPKENGYRSLHTCVYPVPGMSHKPVEIQIRTELMHHEAQFGVAAHWRYKSEEQVALATDVQLQWLRRLLAQHERAFDHIAFLDQLRHQVLDDSLVVFDQSGRQIWLPEGATVRDYVELSTGAGRDDHIVQVNGIVRSLGYTLRDGDTVELTTMA